ncbi:MAG: hypothetical protein NZ891_08840 [bacterium]|nr:hypothetical protein [bacterium]MDW8164827.1 hypothetical protein [Candidatus Omnitrophota bacterium]
MIKIPIDLATTFYLIISVIILFMWIVFEKKRKYIEINESTLWKCPLCFYEYIDSKNKDISRCPRCKALHKKDEK